MNTRVRTSNLAIIGLMLILLFFGGLAVLLGWLGFNGQLG